MILPGQRLTAKNAIYRLGEWGRIKAPSGGGTNAYGKRDKGTFSEIEIEKVVRAYTRGASPEQARVPGGRYRTDSPVLYFAYDSAVEEGFRVEMGDSLYEIDSLTEYPTHFEAATTVVN